jgi:heme oxygenase 2
MIHKLDHSSFHECLCVFLKEQFESDLAFYKGENWKNEYEIRESVQKYLNHLEELNEKNPILLVAYVYHLYMGLLSGGQILAKKRKLKNRIVGIFSKADGSGDSELEPGQSLTTFIGDKTIFELKNEMRKTIDEFAEDLDEKTRQLLIDESKKVFELNNEIIQSVKGVNEQLQKRITNFVISSLLVMFGIYIFMKMWKL